MAALKDVMEGKPLRTPLHPGLVHLPIALFPLSVALDVLSHVTTRGSLQLVPAAFICLLAGLGTAVLAAIFGLVDYTDIRDDHPAKNTATIHLVLNLVAVGLFAASAGLRFSGLSEPSTPIAPLAVSLVGLAVLAYSGYLGGVLVYDDGIGVGRHRRRTRQPQATIVLKAGGKAADVAAETDLADGETLRVQIDGVVACIVRCEGTVHAFQEFCTHRYGPLSEGAVTHCEVTCPWHGSRFDVRSGKVIAGPAKVDLRTFRTEVRNGRIWLYPPESPQ